MALTTRTPLQIITRALRTIGATGTADPIGPEEAQDALDIANAMIDAWATEQTTMYVCGEATYPFVASQQDYTIGLGGNFNQVRPEFIAGVSVIAMNNPAQPLELPIPVYTVQEWQELVPVKNLQSVYPLEVYYKPDFPLGTLRFWPIPNNSTQRVRLYTPTALTGFVDLITSYTFPAGYLEAIVYNLAVRCAPEWSRAVEQDMKDLAVSSLAAVRRKNQVNLVMSSDPAIRGSRQGSYNFYTDQS